MAITKIFNLKGSDVGQRIGRCYPMDSPVEGVFRGVYVKTNDKWLLLLGVISIGGKLGRDGYKQCHYRYDQYEFICKSIRKIEMASLVSEIEKNSKLPVHGLPELAVRDSSLSWTEALVPSHMAEAGFPVKRYSTRLCSDVHCDDRKLIAYDMPYFSSAFSLVKEFLGLEVFHGNSDGRKGELLIDIPDRRGRLVVSDKGVCFHSNSPGDLVVRGEIDGSQVFLDSPEIWYDRYHDESQDIDLWLVDKEGEIVDYRSSSEWEYPYGARLSGSDTRNYLDFISAGESEHCEFKVYIDLIELGQKAGELEKTVCAFSNHEGGNLFIGVDDEIRILGVNEKCRQAYKCDVGEAVRMYQRDVEKRLRESLAKNQCFDVSIIEHGGCYILVVSVRKSSGLNYILSSKDSYIRRGASCTKMTPLEIQLFPKEENYF